MGEIKVSGSLPHCLNINTARRCRAGWHPLGSALCWGSRLGCEEPVQSKREVGLSGLGSDVTRSDSLAAEQRGLPARAGTRFPGHKPLLQELTRATMLTPLELTARGGGLRGARKGSVPVPCPTASSAEGSQWGVEETCSTQAQVRLRAACEGPVGPVCHGREHRDGVRAEQREATSPWGTCSALWVQQAEAAMLESGPCAGARHSYADLKSPASIKHAKEAFPAFLPCLPMEALESHCVPTLQ